MSWKILRNGAFILPFFADSQTMMDMDHESKWLHIDFQVSRFPWLKPGAIGWWNHVTLPVSTNIAGWKMGAPDWVDVFPIENGYIIPASYVRKNQRVIVELLKIQVCNLQPARKTGIQCVSQASAPNALDAKANKYAVIWLQWWDHRIDGLTENKWWLGTHE